MNVVHTIKYWRLRQNITIEIYLLSLLPEIWDQCKGLKAKNFLQILSNFVYSKKIFDIGWLKLCELVNIHSNDYETYFLKSISMENKFRQCSESSVNSHFIEYTGFIVKPVLSNKTNSQRIIHYFNI